MNKEVLSRNDLYVLLCVSLGCVRTGNREAEEESLAKLRELGLLSDPGFGITKKGKVYIDALTRLPLPVCSWSIPR
jgi:hypothetical protein